MSEGTERDRGEAAAIAAGAAGGGDALHEVREYADPTVPGREPLRIDTEAEDADATIPELHEVGIPDELREELEGIIARYPEVRSASIPAMWAIQNRYGWCTPEGIRQAAAVMRVTPAHLESIASFYDQLHLEPIGNNRILVCTNISCWMRGADRLLDAFCAATGIEVAEAREGGASSADREVYVTGFECLGACDMAPMASINARYYGPLADDDAATVIAALRAGTEVLPDRELARRPAAGGPDPEPDPRVAGGADFGGDGGSAEGDGADAG